MAQRLNAVILAGGAGSRMRSAKHKVLHELAGKPMVQHVIDAARRLDPERIVVVVGHAADEVRQALQGQELDFVLQRDQLGTAHAYLQAAPLLEDSGAHSLVLSGDGALLRGATLERLARDAPDRGMALLTARVPDPHGLGRVIKGEDGLVSRIVEHKDAGAAELAVNEIVVGTYLFDGRGFGLARELSNDNAAGEYYITDLIAAYRRLDLPVAATDTPLDEYPGVNDRQQLAAAERLLQDRIRSEWLLSGVTMQDPESVYIEQSVSLAEDVVLEPGVILRGESRVGRGAHIGAHSVVDGAVVPAGVVVPPLSRL